LGERQKVRILMIPMTLVARMIPMILVTPMRIMIMILVLLMALSCSPWS
jgi:hypothetical protein